MGPAAEILQDMGSDVIPEDHDKRGELYDDFDHPVLVSSPQKNQPIDDEIYEELPEEEEDTASVKTEQGKGRWDSVHHPSGDKSTDYANFTRVCGAVLELFLMSFPLSVVMWFIFLARNTIDMAGG